MDIGDLNEGFNEGFNEGDGDNKPRTLPSDLPTSLDDRRHVPVHLVPETEMYDGWQGSFYSLMLGSHIC